ncbi:hypothetical protein SAMN04490201_3241 [Pseudomonas psychrophila]|uniref:Uncharacterized protein n=1 Tax=Pseudomonas psychrophila TaxID=122355 RepID=A0ABY0VXT7_9PSED|nr:hypothetical protein SAMN04490201_3241 [Pseudomonas psychrophila]
MYQAWNVLNAENRANAAALDYEVYQNYWPNLDFCSDARLGGRICGGFWGEGVQRLVTHEARKALIRQTRYRRPLSQRAMYFVFMASR